MSNTKEKLEVIFHSSSVREYITKVVDALKSTGTIFNSFASISSNLYVMDDTELKFYKNNQGMHFNSTEDELLYDGGNFHAPGLMFSLYPEFTVAQKARCFVNAAQIVKDRLSNNDNSPYEILIHNYKESCIYITDCSTKISLSTPTDILTNLVKECDKLHVFATALDNDIRAFVEETVEIIGKGVTIELHTEL